LQPTILTHPHPLLRQQAAAVTRFDDALTTQIAQLQRAMLAGPGGVGIAAPQLGISRRIVVIDCRRSQRPCHNHGLLVMINPEIRDAQGEGLGREGCLSVPDWVATVPRAKRICVHFQDQHGEAHEIHSRHFEARVIQHEIDHLNGILFIDRILSRQALIRRVQRSA